MEAYHLNTCPTARSEGIGHSWDEEEIWGQSNWIQLAVSEWRKASCQSNIFFSTKGRRDRGLGNQQKKQTSHDSSRTPTRYSLEENLCLFPSPSRAREAPSLISPSSDCVLFRLVELWEIFFFVLGSWTLTAFFFLTTLQNIQWTLLTALLIAFN